jgi:hypothetical protein
MREKDDKILLLNQEIMNLKSNKQNLLNPYLQWSNTIFSSDSREVKKIQNSSSQNSPNPQGL